MQTPKEKRKRILDLRRKGLTYSEVSKIVGVTKQRVHQVVKNVRSSKIKSVRSMDADGGYSYSSDRKCIRCEKVFKTSRYRKDICPKCTPQKN